MGEIIEPLRSQVKVGKKSIDVESIDSPSFDLQKELNAARIRELNFKNFARFGLSIFSAILLIGQNAAVFYIVYLALQANELKDLQLIFATLTAATLTETYFIMKIIVQFVFSSSDYSENKQVNPS